MALSVEAEGVDEDELHHVDEVVDDSHLVDVYLLPAQVVLDALVRVRVGGLRARLVLHVERLGDPLQAVLGDGERDEEVGGGPAGQ